MITNKPFLYNSMSELESLGLETPKLNELNDSYEVGNLVDNLKQMLFVEYKSMPVDCLGSTKYVEIQTLFFLISASTSCNNI